MAQWAASLKMPVMFAPVWGEFAQDENIFAHEELCRGLTPPDMILARAAEAVASLPDYERSEFMMSLTHSLGQLPESFRTARAAD